MLGGGRLADHLDADLAEHTLQTLEEERMLVGEDRAPRRRFVCWSY